MARLRIWWHRRVLGHYISEVPAALAVDYHDYTCRLYWKLPRKGRR